MTTPYHSDTIVEQKITDNGIIVVTKTKYSSGNFLCKIVRKSDGYTSYRSITIAEFLR